MEAMISSTMADALCLIKIVPMLQPLRWARPLSKICGFRPRSYRNSVSLNFPWIRSGTFRLRGCAALSERGTALRRGDMAAHYAPRRGDVNEKNGLVLKVEQTGG